jgi:hypothetical protein
VVESRSDPNNAVHPKQLLSFLQELSSSFPTRQPRALLLNIIPRALTTYCTRQHWFMSSSDIIYHYQTQSANTRARWRTRDTTIKPSRLVIRGRPANGKYGECGPWAKQNLDEMKSYIFTEIDETLSQTPEFSWHSIIFHMESHEYSLDQRSPQIFLDFWAGRSLEDSVDFTHFHNWWWGHFAKCS